MSGARALFDSTEVGTARKWSSHAIVVTPCRREGGEGPARQREGRHVRDKGQQQAEAILQAEDDVDVVYSHNDPMAEGAYLAADAAGRLDGLEIIGIDALPIPAGGIKAVEEGRLSATFTYPTGGKEAVEAAKKLLIDCAELPKEQILETQRITEENAADVYSELNRR